MMEDVKSKIADENECDLFSISLVKKCMQKQATTHCLYGFVLLLLVD